MKNRLLLFFLLALPLSASNFSSYFVYESAYETNYEKAIQKAKQEHKSVMLVMVTKYCPFCRRFKQDTLSDSRVHEKIMKEYIPLMLDKRKDSYPKSFLTPVTPTVFFFEPGHEDEATMSLGYKDVNSFLNEIEDANFK